MVVVIVAGADENAQLVVEYAGVREAGDVAELIVLVEIEPMRGPGCVGDVHPADRWRQANGGVNVVLVDARAHLILVGGGDAAVGYLRVVLMGGPGDLLIAGGDAEGLPVGAVKKFGRETVGELKPDFIHAAILRLLGEKKVTEFLAKIRIGLTAGQLAVDVEGPVADALVVLGVA